MDKAKVIITGGAGFIGKNLANFLLRKNYSVLVLDDLSSGNLKELNNKINFEKISILNEEKLEIQFKKFKPDYVFHLAALNMRSPNAGEELLNINILGTQNVLRCSVNSSVKKVIYSSSAAVYGNAEKFPISESSELKPLNTYGVSKLASEYLVKSILDGSGVSYSILRLSNVYGPGQRSDNEGGVVSIFCEKIKNGRKVTVFGDGKQTRDFVYIDDVVDAMYKSMLSSVSFTANVASKTETSVNDLLKLDKYVAGKNSETDNIYKKSLDLEIVRSVLSNLKIKKLLKWKPTVNLQKGLYLTYNSLV